jgi:hypothetical protein
MNATSEAELLAEIERLQKRISELETRADRNQHTHQNLQQIEWMLAGKRPEHAGYVPDYGDLSLLNQDGLILTTAGRQNTADSEQYVKPPHSFRDQHIP